MSYPENFRYTKEHEWVRVEGDIGTIGITDHAQEELGDIVYVDLPKVGAAVAAGRDHRAASNPSRRSPTSTRRYRAKWSRSTSCSRRVPEKLNQDPHGAAWLVKVKLIAPDEIKSLLGAADYQSYIGG